MGTWLPCPDAQASVPPFYDEIPGLKRPPRNRFVISISSVDHMPLTSGSAGRQLMPNRPWGPFPGKRRRRPPGGRAGAAYGPALGGEAGSVLLEAYSAVGPRMNEPPAASANEIRTYLARP